MATKINVLATEKDARDRCLLTDAGISVCITIERTRKIASVADANRVDLFRHWGCDALPPRRRISLTPLLLPLAIESERRARAAATHQTLSASDPVGDDFHDERRHHPASLGFCGAKCGADVFDE